MLCMLVQANSAAVPTLVAQSTEGHLTSLNIEVHALLVQQTLDREWSQRQEAWRAPPRLLEELQVMVRLLRNGCFLRRIIAGCLPPLEPLRASETSSHSRL